MLLKTYTREEFVRARCARCQWILNKFPRDLYKDGKCIETCPNCGELYGYGEFPGTQSSHIVGGMIHFIKSYNEKIQTPKHIYPPEAYLPIIFACSNYETLLADLVNEIMSKYGSYLGRLGRTIIFQETIGRYDKRANERLFKLFTGASLREDVNAAFPTYFKEFDEINDVRNKVVHGREIDNSEQAFKYLNRSIDFMLISCEVFAYLHNKFCCKFLESVDYKKILFLGAGETFSP